MDNGHPYPPIGTPLRPLVGVFWHFPTTSCAKRLRYQELFEFQRLFTSSLRRYLDAQQASLRATAHALGEDEAHALDRVAQRVEAQELEKELKVEVGAESGAWMGS